MAKPNLRLVAPTTENLTVTPRRAPNAQLRTRERLTADEVEKLTEAAKESDTGAGGIAQRLAAALAEGRADPEGSARRFRERARVLIAETEAAARDHHHVPPLQLRIASAYRRILRDEEERTIQ